EDQRPVGLVGKDETAGASLDERSREESAVEKRHLPERGGMARTFSCRCIERPEKQRPQHATMKVSARYHARIKTVGEKRAVAIEPAFRLEKAEEEQPGRVEQCDLPSSAVAADSR